MSERNGLLRRNFRVFLLLAVFAAVIYLIVRNIGAFGNVLLVVIGFWGDDTGSRAGGISPLPSFRV